MGGCFGSVVRGPIVVRKGDEGRAGSVDLCSVVVLGGWKFGGNGRVGRGNVDKCGVLGLPTGRLQGMHALQPSGCDLPNAT